MDFLILLKNKRSYSPTNDIEFEKLKITQSKNLKLVKLKI